MPGAKQLIMGHGIHRRRNKKTKSRFIIVSKQDYSKYPGSVEKVLAITHAFGSHKANQGLV